jgi:hypothetical protein
MARKKRALRPLIGGLRLSTELLEALSPGGAPPARFYLLR